MKKKYFKSNWWSYEKETIVDDESLYHLYCEDEFVCTCPSWAFVKDVIKAGNKGATKEGKIELATEFAERF